MKSSFQKFICLLAIVILAQSPATSNAVEIDYRCCGTYVGITPEYSNAVLVAVLPAIAQACKRLKLPVNLPLTETQVAKFTVFPLVKKKGDVNCSLRLKNGFSFGYGAGHVTGFTDPTAYFILQDPAKVPQYFGIPQIDAQQAILIARQALVLLGINPADAMADGNPIVIPFENVGTNVIPRYRIKWLDPRSGAKAVEIEINGENQKVASIHTFNLVALNRPSPKIAVSPGESTDLNRKSMNDFALFINHDYAEKLLPIILEQAAIFGKKLGIGAPSRILKSDVKRIYISNNGGVPYAQLTLKNNWQYTFHAAGITYIASPKRFFDSEKIPFKLADFQGPRAFTDDQAVELAKATLKKLDLPENFLKTDAIPAMLHPVETTISQSVPRVLIEWVYPAKPSPMQQWIEVEVDCKSGAVASVHVDDWNFWGKRPKLDVSIEPRQVSNK